MHIAENLSQATFLCIGLKENGLYFVKGEIVPLGDFIRGIVAFRQVPWITCNTFVVISSLNELIFSRSFIFCNWVQVTVSFVQLLQDEIGNGNSYFCKYPQFETR